MLEEERIPKDK
jgi:hypothetical protein